MKRIIDGRGTGKTKKLLEFAREHDTNVVCANPLSMQRKAEAYGIYGLNFYPYHKVFEDGVPGPIVIDEYELFMGAFAHDYMIGYTLTNED